MVSLPPTFGGFKPNGLENAQIVVVSTATRVELMQKDIEVKYDHFSIGLILRLACETRSRTMVTYHGHTYTLKVHIPWCQLDVATARIRIPKFNSSKNERASCQVF